MTTDVVSVVVNLRKMGVVEKEVSKHGETKSAVRMTRRKLRLGSIYLGLREKEVPVICLSKGPPEDSNL